MKTGKRVIALVLAAVLILGVAPISFATENPFVDVRSDAYYYDPVLWAVNNGITSGIDATHFGPTATCNRAQVVTFLWRANGCPEPEKANNPFTDVEPGKFYEKAVLWAVEKGITSGISATAFGPNEGCTRAQVVTFLWRAAGKPKPAKTDNPFTDVTRSYYYDAVLWAVGHDPQITSGTTKTLFSPDQTCMRGQIVTFLYRAVKDQPPVEADPLSIISQPQGASIADGHKVTLTVDVSGGTLPYTYQWHVNGIVINGANSASYTTGEAGSYTCTITDGNGKSITTNAAVVTVYGTSDKPYRITYKLVEYNVNKGDQYIGTQYIDNSKNQKHFGSTDSFELEDVACPGYEFLGWFTAGGTRITEVAAGTTRDLTLYARWSEITYTITYNLYQTPVTSAPSDEQKCYTVNKGNYNLYNPVINNYVFLGWYDDNGVEYKNIPIGTTGNIVLNAYYTSLRNLAVSKIDNNPIIVEDRNANVVYFTYEIGEIRNVPLTPDKPFWEIQSVAGLTQHESDTYTETISEEAAISVAKTVSDMTVSSNTWTLASTWNDVTTVNDSWAQSIGKTAEECRSEATTASSTLSISDQMGGSSYHRSEDGSTVYDYDTKTVTKDKGHQFDVNASGSYSNKLSANFGESSEYGTEESYNSSNAYTYEGKETSANWSSYGSGSASDKDKYSAGISYENGYEINADLRYGYQNNTNTVTKTGSDTVTVNSDIDENTSSWNSSACMSATNQHSISQSVRNTLSDVVTTTKSYGSSYSKGGTDSTTQGFSSTSSNTSGTTSTVTYKKTASKVTTTEYSVDGKIEGKYRCILAGTAHVFAVVGYDYNTKSYFTYTFSVMDDKTEEFLDYTPKGGNYTDCENSCLPFEVPIDVFEYVSNRTAKTTDVQYRTNSLDGTAKIIGYTGTDADVIIPSYVSDGKQAYKVTSISSTAFAGKPVRAVVLGEFIKSIPDRAFKNCSSLEAVVGSFTEIGDEAFAGCTNLTKMDDPANVVNMNIPSNVVKVGEDAFKGVGCINVRAINSLCAYSEAVESLPNGTDEEIEKKQRELTQEYIESVLNSGAQRIILDLSKIATNTQLTIEVPEIDSIEINGGTRTYNNLILKSKANNTTLNEMTIRNTNAVPLTIDSGKLTLHKVFVSGNAIALILKKDGAVLSLSQDSALESTAKYTVVSKNPLIEAMVSAQGAVGYLNIFGDFGYVNSIQGEENLAFTEGMLRKITDQEFENYIKGTFVITFNGNGGVPAVASKTIYSGSPIGELPTATRDYYKFTGWYTEAAEGAGERVTTDYTFSADTTLYAHWELNPVSDWVPASEVPADAEILDQKWTYTETTNTESRETTLDGYTCTGSYWVKSGSGSKNYASFPGGFNTGHWIYTNFAKSVPYTKYEDETSKRDVSNSWSGYVYWHWMYNVHYANRVDRTIADKRCDYENKSFQYFFAMTSSVNCPALTGNDAGYVVGYYASNAPTCYNCHSILPASTGPTDGLGTPRMLRFDYYTSYYTDYYKMFQYQKVENKESFTEVTEGGSISNVQEWVQYRAK